MVTFTYCITIGFLVYLVVWVITTFYLIHKIEANGMKMKHPFQFALKVFFDIPRLFVCFLRGLGGE